MSGNRKHIILSSLLIAALSITGCGTAEVTAPQTTVISESDYELFVFNSHVYSSFLEACYPEEYREAFFSLCDALNEGRDTFECKNKDAYDFCMDPVTLNQLCPAAYGQISGEFRDGTGYITYETSAGEYLIRQQEFQKDIEDVLGRYIKSDYSDIDKCLVLYDYMATNYQYGDPDINGQANGGDCYACFKSKQGICVDLGTLYAYLLMQCGVDAIEVENSGMASSAGFHAWTYVSIGGKNYHIDVTAALKSGDATPGIAMDFFLVTDRDRDAAGYIYDELEIPLIHMSAKDCSSYSFIADDESYRLPEGSYCTGYDIAKGIIYYKDPDGEQEFRYA